MKTHLSKPKQPLRGHKLINEAIDILKSVGIPMKGKRDQALEKMAVCFLAVAGVTNNWKETKSFGQNRNLRGKEIIEYANANFDLVISSRFYYVRRKYLRLLLLADLIVCRDENTKAITKYHLQSYSLHPDFKNLLLFYNTPKWEINLKLFFKDRQPLSEILARKRNILKIPVKLPGGKEIQLSQGGHNQLQREVIEEFLPRFGKGCEILYIGDTSDRILHIEEAKLQKLGFFKLSNKELPDIIAYSSKMNWLFLIEVVYSSGTMSEERILELKKLLKKCKAHLIFVTVFTSRSDFKKWFSDIGWETEVWTADNPDHMVHFNGDKFLGPYKS